jgi:hypothetical protein
MDGRSTQPRKARLDKEEREHLEDVVTEMRDRVEANVRYQLKDEYDLDQKPTPSRQLFVGVTPFLCRPCSMTSTTRRRY